jgi:hypothetical protein
MNRPDEHLPPGVEQDDLDDEPPPPELEWGFTPAELEKADQDEDR